MIRAIASLLVGASASAADLDVAFELVDDGVPVDDTCDVRVSVFDAAAGGVRLSGPTTIAGVDVLGGFAHLTLPNAETWATTAGAFLELDVRCGGDTAFESLPRRYPTTDAPVAVVASTAEVGPRVASASIVDAPFVSTSTLASATVTLDADGVVVVEFSGTAAVEVAVDHLKRQDCQFDYTGGSQGGYELVLELDDGGTLVRSPLFKQSAVRYSLPQDAHPVVVQALHAFAVPAGTYEARVVASPHAPPNEACEPGVHSGIVTSVVSGTASGTLVATSYPGP